MRVLKYCDIYLCVIRLDLTLYIGIHLEQIKVYLSSSNNYNS